MHTQVLIFYFFFFFRKPTWSVMIGLPHWTPPIVAVADPTSLPLFFWPLWLTSGKTTVTRLSTQCSLQTSNILPILILLHHLDPVANGRTPCERGDEANQPEDEMVSNIDEDEEVTFWSQPHPETSSFRKRHRSVSSDDESFDLPYAENYDDSVVNIWHWAFVILKICSVLTTGQCTCAMDVYCNGNPYKAVFRQYPLILHQL